MKKLATALFILVWAPQGFATDSPMSLTASDGTGLEMHRLEARVVLDGFLAFTELEMVFYNSQNRWREGRFQIVLPDNAAISRFAMKIWGQLQEGEVVEKQKARRVYEDFLHRRQDPALLEMDSGNRFNARIFPIEANSEKLLILSYSQRLDGINGEYVLPLKGLPQLKQLSIQVFYDSDSFSTTQLSSLNGTLSKPDVLTIDKSDYQPTDDFRMSSQMSDKNLAMQSRQFMAARIIPFTESISTRQGFDNLIVLIDTSASQAPYFLDSLKRLEILLSQLKIDHLRLYTFDQNIKEIGTADTLRAQKALIKQLNSYPALGASRLDNAITTLKALQLEKSRLLIISDVAVTAGETSATALATQLKTVEWLERTDILIPSYYSDKTVARRLAKDGGQLPGIVAPLTLSDADLIRKLTHSVYADIPITVPDSTWYWPKTVDVLQTNEPLIMFAAIPLKKQSSSKGVRIQVGDKTLSLTSQTANPILLKREWVRARLDKLLAMEDEVSVQYLKEYFRERIIDLSIKERVLSPYTALLVLETENDYQLYNIDRRGLADILTVGVEGLKVIKPTKPESMTPLPSSPSSVDRFIDDNEADQPMPEPQPEMRKEEPSAIPPPQDSDGDGVSDNQDLCPGSPFGMDVNETGCAHVSDRRVPILQCDVTFAVNKSVLTDEAKKTLENFLYRYHQFEYRSQFGLNVFKGIEVVGHTDSEGSEERNQKLSEKRAKSVADYLISLGIRCISSWGEGERQPIAPDDTKEYRAMNRRVKIRIIPEGSSERMICQQAWTGNYAEFRALLDKGEIKAAGKLAQKWRQDNLADVMALIALGEWYEKTGDIAQAARAYGSLIDYFPARADIRRWAAERLLAIKSELWLSIDSLEKAVKQRPDHPSGHYLLAIASWEAGQYKKAVETLQVAKDRQFQRFPSSVNRFLNETLAIMLTRLEHQQQLETLFPGQTLYWNKFKRQQLRLVLMWETDANDVDLYISDNQQDYAQQWNLSSGGKLDTDIATGYGPECFQIFDPKAFPYKVQAYYDNMGPMGYGMGVLHILGYDLETGLHSEFRPFVMMNRGASVELGVINKLVP